MQNNIPTVHISENHCYIVKSNNLSNIFGVLYKKYNKRKREAAFSVDQLLILPVNQCLENIGEGLLHVYVCCMYMF